MAVSLKDIAERAGVSSVAVSMALRDDARISVARRQQIRKIAEEVGYRPNPIARAMRTKRSQTVGFLLADLRTATSNLKIEAIEHRLARSGHQVLLGFTGADEKRLITYVEDMLARQVDGLIVFGPHGQSSQAWRHLHKRLPADTPPIVLADPQASAGKLFRQIVVDRAAATCLATKHLLDLGHRELMYVGPLGGSSGEKWRGVAVAVRQAANSLPRQQRVRFAAFGSATFCEADDISHRSRWVPPTMSGSVSDAVQASIAVADRIADLPPHDRPTAIIAASDLIAMALIGRLQDRGLQVPLDISVVGFDGDEFGQRLFRPRLTTLQQPRDAMADLVVQTLLSLMAGDLSAGDVTRVQAVLVLGDSTAPPTHTLAKD